LLKKKKKEKRDIPCGRGRERDPILERIRYNTAKDEIKREPSLCLTRPDSRFTLRATASSKGEKRERRIVGSGKKVDHGNPPGSTVTDSRP